MLRCIRDAELGFRGQRFYGSFALAEQIQQFQSLGTGDRLADSGKLIVNSILKLAFGRDRVFHERLFNYSTVHLNTSIQDVCQQQSGIAARSGNMPLPHMKSVGEEKWAA